MRLSSIFSLLATGSCLLLVGCSSDDSGGGSTDDSGIHADTAATDTGTKTDSKVDSAPGDTAKVDSGSADTTIPEDTAISDTPATDTATADTRTDSTADTHADAPADTKADTPVPADTAIDASDSSETSAAMVTLTIRNFLSWCTVTANGSPVTGATVKVPAGVVVTLNATPAATVWPFRYWQVGTTHYTNPYTPTPTSDMTIDVCCTTDTEPCTF